MSNFGGLSTAVSGLGAHQRRIEVISENIANVNTPGYKRRVAQLAPLGHAEINGVFAGRGATGTGVEVKSIHRLGDTQLEQNARDHAGVAAGLNATVDALRRVEEAVGGLTPGGIGDQLTGLWNSFDDLGNAPDDPAMREVVLQKADNVSASFNRGADNLFKLRETEAGAFADRVADVNRLTEQIAEIDGQALAGNGDRSQVNGLLDTRDRLVGELAAIAPIDVATHQDGQLTITIDGYFVVSNSASRSLAVQQVEDPALTPLGLTRTAVVGESGRELRLASGELSGRQSTINDVIPDQIHQLDDIAAELVNQVNTLHSAGVAGDGSTGHDLFDLGPKGAFTLSVSADVAGQPERLAAGGPGQGPLDDTTARTLAGLGEAAGGPRAGFDQMVTRLAGKVAAASTRAEASSSSAAVAANIAEGASGVSLDEELTDLITAQRAYEASARLITTIDQMLETLISRTGIVGR